MAPPGIARLNEPVSDAILGAADFDLKKGMTKAFTRGMVHADRVTPERIDVYERPFNGVEGRHAYLRAARALRTEELASRMASVEALEQPTLILWGSNDIFQPRALGEHRLCCMAGSGSSRKRVISFRRISHSSSPA